LGALVDSFFGSERPIVIVATPALQVASASALRLSRAVIAYSAPAADAAIGAVEPRRVYTLTERLGTDWLLADVIGSGKVWLRLIDLAGLANVPDIATPALPAAQGAPAVLIAAPTRAERAVQPTVAPPTPPVAPPTPAMQI
jgi:hypothetical protein